MRFGGRTNAKSITRNIPEKSPRIKTVIVVGHQRGGTSVVAAVLDALGVYMGPPGELRHGGCFESYVFVHGSEEYKLAEINHLNKTLDVWGYKIPNGVIALDSVPTTVRNLHCIFVFRDLLASTQAYMHHASLEFERAIAFMRVQDGLLFDRATTTELPSLLVSYERIISTPIPFIASVIEFLNLNCNDDQKAQARTRISPSGGYTRMPRSYGRPAALPPHETPMKWGKKVL